MGTKVCFFKVITKSQDTFHNFTLHGLRKAFLGKGKIHKSARCRCFEVVQYLHHALEMRARAKISIRHEQGVDFIPMGD